MEEILNLYNYIWKEGLDLKIDLLKRIVSVTLSVVLMFSMNVPTLAASTTVTANDLALERRIDGLIDGSIIPVMDGVMPFSVELENLKNVVSSEIVAVEVVEVPQSRSIGALSSYEALVVTRAALKSEKSDELVDVYYFCRLNYDRIQHRDVSSGIYKVTSVQGGVTRISDPQMSCKNMTLSYYCGGNRYKNSTEPRSVGAENKTSSNFAGKTGTTYSLSGPTSGWYYATDGSSFVSGRIDITVRRNVSSYEATAYMWVNLNGNPFG